MYGGYNICLADLIVFTVPAKLLVTILQRLEEEPADPFFMFLTLDSCKHLTVSNRKVLGVQIPCSSHCGWCGFESAAASWGSSFTAEVQDHQHAVLSTQILQGRSKWIKNETWGAAWTKKYGTTTNTCLRLCGLGATMWPTRKAYRCYRPECNKKEEIWWPAGWRWLSVSHFIEGSGFIFLIDWLCTQTWWIFHTWSIININKVYLVDSGIRQWALYKLW